MTSFSANRQGLPGLSLIRAVQEGCKEKMGTGAAMAQKGFEDGKIDIKL